MGSENDTIQRPLNQILKILELKHNIQLDRLEKRQLHIIPPWRIPPFTYIAKSAETAIKQDATEPGTLYIYTNGSGIM
jgi:hypothetical protein